MTTYGPFYPSSLINVAGSGTEWTITGGAASAVLGAEGVTKFLQATGFNTSLPSNAIVTGVRLAPLPDTVQAGFNNSDQFIDGTTGEQQAYVVQPELQVETANVPTLDRAAVLDSSFTFRFALFSQNGGTVSLSSVGLYVDCE